VSRSSPYKDALLYHPSCRTEPSLVSRNGPGIDRRRKGRTERHFGSKACLRLSTCLRSSRSPVGDQCQQAARIVNQDEVARGILQTVPHSLVASPNSSARQPSRYG